MNESKFTLSEVPAPGRACDRFEAQTRTDHNDPPLTILATFTVPAPISVAVRLRRVWYRSAAPIVASNGLHLSSVPKVVDLFMSPRTPRTSNWSLATLRRPLRYAKMTVASPGRSRIAAARRAATAHARRDSCVRRWGFACSWILALRASFYMPKARVSRISGRSGSPNISFIRPFLLGRGGGSK